MSKINLERERERGWEGGRGDRGAEFESDTTPEIVVSVTKDRIRESLHRVI